MSVTVKRVDRKSSQRFYELIVETSYRWCCLICLKVNVFTS